MTETTDSDAPQPTKVANEQDAGDCGDLQPTKAQHDVEQQRPTTPRIIRVKCKLRLQCQDLSHAGSAAFFTACHPARLDQAVQRTLTVLYNESDFEDDLPPTRSVTLILESMDGVAFTRGIDLDNDHKEIHLSLDYIHNVSAQSRERVEQEIRGVIVHEMVHAWQWNAGGSAPGGLIEGIADFVRLSAGLAPPHWKRTKGSEWDQGYQHTAYFLRWIEARFGRGSVRRVNRALRHGTYDKEKFWPALFDDTVDRLWEQYQATLPDESTPSRQMRHGERGTE